MRTRPSARALRVLVAIAFVLAFAAPGLAVDSPALATKSGAPAVTGQVADQPGGDAAPARPAVKGPAAPGKAAADSQKAPPASTQPWEGGGDGSHANLVGRAIDPISNLGRVELEEAFNPSYTNSRSSGNTFSIKPVIPITSKGFPDQLLRVNIPIQWPAGRQTSMGDVQILDLFGDAQKWGRFGFGPVFVLPTANTRAAGEGKWQVGPALGFMYTRVPHACLGFLAQNPISVAGDSARKDVNHLWFQPLLTWQVGRGWYLVSDAQMTFDWLDKGVSIPVNIGVGRVFNVGRQAVNLSMKYECSVYHKDMAVPNHTIRLKLILLYP